VKGEGRREKGEGGTPAKVRQAPRLTTDDRRPTTDD
jgi:hypothetical protein